MNRITKESRVTFEGILRRRQKKCRGGGCPCPGGFLRKPLKRSKRGLARGESGRIEEKEERRQGYMEI